MRNQRAEFENEEEYLEKEFDYYFEKGESSIP
jgi:hypothetical protein